jgi:XrtN system VIT domain protein
METIKAPGSRAKELIAQSNRNLIPANDYLAGLFILVILLLVFIITKETRNESVALITQSISVAYTVFLLFTKKMKVFWKKQPEESLVYRLLAWQIWIISCFTLNRVINVFNESVTWLSVAFIVSCLSSILFYWEAQFPKRLKEGLYISLAFSTILWAYMSIYTINWYVLGFVGIIVLGIGLHIFIPLLLFIAHIKLLKKGWQLRNNAILFGILAPVIFTIFFVVRWNITQNTMQEAYQKSFTKPSDEFPNWVVVAQKTDNNWISERVLQSDLVYRTVDERFHLFSPRFNNFRGIQHDPLIMTASLFSGKISLTQEEKGKILETIHDIRHENQERLWSGDQLETRSIVNQILIYPEYRMAYTEKTLVIANTSKDQWQSQEAIYTFYLPEGSVATSLSLWINDKEEKGYLTTKNKADSAYKAIVGVERRDPAVVHWQEGNTLSIRVFPCTSQKTRQFKIGITSPLKEENGRLIYENIYFKGPEATHADEEATIHFSQFVTDLLSPWSINEDAYIYAFGNFTPDWQLSFKAPALSKKAFSFKGKSYVLSPLVAQKETYNPDIIYLDINAEWNKSEFDKLYSTFNQKELWVWKDGLIRLNEKNKDILFYELKENNFSLFPLYQIHTKSLFITKGNTKAPTMKDLEGSGFANSIKNSNTGAIQLVSLNETLSPYLKTLKELGVVVVNWSTAEKLKSEGLYRIPPPSTQQSVNIESAKIQIAEVAATNEKSDAPDHLLRLYAYNHIMQQIGANYFIKDYLFDAQIQEATAANIVTPVSSLIVLETQADYEHFGIKQRKDSLENASFNSFGSVPEPHEWLLIITFASIIIYLLLKRII